MNLDDFKPPDLSGLTRLIVAPETIEGVVTAIDEDVTRVHSDLVISIVLNEEARAVYVVRFPHILQDVCRIIDVAGLLDAEAAYKIACADSHAFMILLRGLVGMRFYVNAVEHETRATKRKYTRYEWLRA